MIVRRLTSIIMLTLFVSESIAPLAIGYAGVMDEMRAAEPTESGATTPGDTRADSKGAQEPIDLSLPTSAAKAVAAATCGKHGMSDCCCAGEASCPPSACSEGAGATAPGTSGRPCFTSPCDPRGQGPVFLPLNSLKFFSPDSGNSPDVRRAEPAPASPDALVGSRSPLPSVPPPRIALI